jgi:hypothetical protein
MVQELTKVGKQGTQLPVERRSVAVSREQRADEASAGQRPAVQGHSRGLDTF